MEYLQSKALETTPKSDRKNRLFALFFGAVGVRHECTTYIGVTFHIYSIHVIDISLASYLICAIFYSRHNPYPIYAIAICALHLICTTPLCRSIQFARPHSRYVLYALHRKYAESHMQDILFALHNISAKSHLGSVPFARHPICTSHMRDIPFALYLAS